MGLSIGDNVTAASGLCHPGLNSTLNPVAGQLIDTIAKSVKDNLPLPITA